MKVVLLRGLMREIRHWGQFPSLLQQQPNITSVHCIDLPGIGEMKATAYPNSVAKACQIIRNEFLKLPGAKQGEWLLAGNSLGGMISLEWQNLYPNDFQKVVFINTSASNHGKTWQRLKPNAMKLLVKILKANTAEIKESLILKMVSNFAWKDQSIVNEWIQIAKENPIHYKTAIMQLVSASLYRSPKIMHTPALFITSKKDNMVSYKCSKSLANYYDANIIYHDSAGHDIAIDDPVWLSQIINNFIQQT